MKMRDAKGACIFGKKEAYKKFLKKSGAVLPLGKTVNLEIATLIK
jgi:hypothetical protein